MLHIISEENYNEIVTFTNLINTKKKDFSYDPSFSDQELNDRQLEYKNNVIVLYNEHQSKFVNKSEKIIFKLNLLIPENELFAASIERNCYRELSVEKMDKVPELFSFKDFIYKEKWNRIIKRIAREFLVTEEAASVKIEEILMFPNIYYPKKEIEGNVKSLS
jgi:hypothetical protein